MFVYRLLLSLAILAAVPAAAQNLPSVSEEKTVDVVLSAGMGTENGRWRSHVQVVHIGGRDGVERRLYEVFDPTPSLDLDFYWRPDDHSLDRPGRISGNGSLVWRRKDVPVYDEDGAVAVYRGTMRGGQPEGQGLYATRRGLLYEGQWRGGRPNGKGRLVLPGGEQYVGAFRDGFADGEGLFTETTWERFEGHFRRGLREGTGRTTLPSGLSYQSTWRAGHETPNSRRIRVAQSAGAMPVGGVVDVGFGVTLNNAVRLPAEIRRKEVLLYTSRMTPQGLRIEPDDREMVETWMGQRPLVHHTYWGVSPRDGFFSIETGFVQPVSFKLDIQNKSPRSVELVSVAINVEQSATENRPALDMTSDFLPECHSGLTPQFTVFNRGWEVARNGRMMVGFSADGASRRAAKLDHVIKVGDLNEEKTINYENILSEAGVNLAALKTYQPTGDDNPTGQRSLPCTSNDGRACLRTLQKNPMFGKLGPLLRLDEGTVYVMMVGDYSYVWKDFKGQNQQTTTPFEIPVGLGVVPSQGECGAGGPPEALRNEASMLRLDRKNYVILVPFRRAVPPGRTASFTLRVEAEKSSTHQFKFVAKLSDGRTLQSPPMDLLYYRPRQRPMN